MQKQPTRAIVTEQLDTLFQQVESLRHLAVKGQQNGKCRKGQVCHAIPLFRLGVLPWIG